MKKTKKTPQQLRTEYKNSLIRENDRMARALALQRDNYECQMTGRRSNLEVHHIYPKNLYRHMRWELENLITLNFMAHKYGKKSAHGDGVEFAKWLAHKLSPDRLQYLHEESQRIAHIDITWIEMENIRLRFLCNKHGIDAEHPERAYQEIQGVIGD